MKELKKQMETAMDERLESNRKAAQMIYILYALGFLTAGLTTLVGVIIAYIKRPEAKDSWVQSHFTWLIRTFWIMVIGTIIAFITIIILIGPVIGFILTIWLIVRIVKGWLALSDGRAIGIDEPPAPLQE